MYKQFLLYSICISLPFNMQGTVSYDLLNRWFQASQPREADSTPTDRPKPQTYTYIPSVSRAQRVQILSEILQRRNPHEASNKQLQRLVNLFTDISLFTNDGAKPHKTIMSRIDRTTSAAGTLALHRMASTNLASEDPELFARRQEFIKKLAYDNDLFNKVKGICQTWAKHENNLIANWPSKESEYFKQSFNDRNYHGTLSIPLTEKKVKVPFFEALNNELMLNVYTQAFLTNIVGSVIKNVALTLGVDYVRGTTQSWTDHFKNAFYALNPLEGIDFVYFIFKQLQPAPPFSAGDQAIQLVINKNKNIAQDKTTLTPLLYVPMKWDHFTHSNHIQPAYLIGCAKAVTIGYSLYSWYSAYQNFTKQREDVRYAHDKNIGLSAALESAEALQQLVSEYPELQNALVFSNELNSLKDEAANNDELQKLISLLKRNGTQKEISMLWDSGHTLMAHRLIDDKNQKEAFAGITEMIGEVDACLSIAKLYKERKDELVKYCFGKIIDHKKPQLRLQGMWYPLLNPKKAVTNDFAMGEASKPHGIITGSNTAGKSTSGLKSPLASLWLSHSLGIAPAASCESSRIGMFGSYLHVVDDPASGKSAFKAELDRVGDMIKDVEALPENRHAFIVLDELFRGTAPEPAEHGSIKVAEYFSTKSKVLSLLATHFKGVAQKLPQLTGKHANYRVDAEIKEDGTIERDFKIKEGISNTNIAYELFKRDLGTIFQSKTNTQDLPDFTKEVPL